MNYINPHQRDTMTTFGRMDLTSWTLFVANRLFTTAIRLLPSEREQAFDLYYRLVRRISPRFTGRTYFGAAINCRIEDHIMKRIFFFNVWEPYNSRLIQSVLRPGDTFVDVGANVGYDSLLGSKLIGPEGRVIAIEAARSIFEQLGDNLARNGVANVRLVKVAVSDKPGELTLFGGDRGNQGRTSPIQRDNLVPVETVPTKPLDDILTDDERASVRLIKIDIEGGELPVLERLVDTLHLYGPSMSLLVEMSEDASGRSRVVFDKLLAAGFSAYQVENDYSLSSYLRSQPRKTPLKITSLPKSQTDIFFERPNHSRSLRLAELAG
ncbi:FkbM family methyltransferase [Bradyrhizobium sp. SSUT18]|uniref:FkbM family methyltransferase n=1 Tax=Bradyrhizobium sp. SSUT18 TaxID=3040602 RepID=UPI00244A905F|nr:FkbM family methyltransferase [Bradyrhizobium sp. SSUT18]MDH2406107.1 FkbM family methyltransferase [Bradyrhizobium sp. SSUT18]